MNKIKKTISLLSILAFTHTNLAYAQDQNWWEVDASSTTSTGTSEVEDGSSYKGMVSLEGEFLDGDILKISVFADEMVVPVLGLAFHLSYDVEALSFLKYTPGDFLEKGGDPFYMVKNNEKSGEIVFGETLRRDDNFPLEGGEIADIYFQTNKEQAYSFSFENGVVSTLDVVRQDIDKIMWKDATISRDGSVSTSTTNQNGNKYDKNGESQGGQSSGILKFIIPIVIVLTGFGAGLTLYLIWKKYGKNLHPPSVKFK